MTNVWKISLHFRTILIILSSFLLWLEISIHFDGLPKSVGDSHLALWANFWLPACRNNSGLCSCTRWTSSPSLWSGRWRTPVWGRFCSRRKASSSYLYQSSEPRWILWRFSYFFLVRIYLWKWIHELMNESSLFLKCKSDSGFLPRLHLSWLVTSVASSISDICLPRHQNFFPMEPFFSSLWEFLQWN